MYDNYEKDLINFELPYKHRWSPIYRNFVLAKMYGINDFWEARNRPEITFLTLTTYQGNTKTTRAARGESVSILEAFDLLYDSWRKLRVSMAKNIIGHSFDYVGIVEPHLSGYPHMHVIIFEPLSDNQINSIKKLWSEKYKAGSYRRGVNAEKNEDIELKCRDDIKNIGFYAFKYLGKSFGKDPFSMTRGELLFSAALHHNHRRQILCSRSVSAFLKERQMKRLSENIERKIDLGADPFEFDSKRFDFCRSYLITPDCAYVLKDHLKGCYHSYFLDSDMLVCDTSSRLDTG